MVKSKFEQDIRKNDIGKLANGIKRDFTNTLQSKFTNDNSNPIHKKKTKQAKQTILSTLQINYNKKAVNNMQLHTNITLYTHTSMRKNSSKEIVLNIC